MSTAFPALNDLTTVEVTQLMMACMMSPEPSDKEFAQECREEIKRRKQPLPQHGSKG